MTKTLKISLAAALFAAGSTSAMAAHHEKGGDHTRAEAEARAAQAFAKMDANGDGQINAADREARAKQRFAKVDADGNGQLSFEETQAAREAHGAKRGERRAEMKARAGGQGGAHASAGEHGGKHGHKGKRGGKRGQMAKAMLMKADANGDKSISQAEFTAAALARFDATDANKDGTVTADERKAHMQEMRGKMKARMQERRAAQAG